MLFPLLAVAVPASSALVTFLVVAILAALFLAYAPGFIGGDATVWKVVRVVVVAFMIVYALALFGVI